MSSAFQSNSFQDSAFQTISNLIIKGMKLIFGYPNDNPFKKPSVIISFKSYSCSINLINTE